MVIKMEKLEIDEDCRDLRYRLMIPFLEQSESFHCFRSF